MRHAARAATISFGLALGAAACGGHSATQSATTPTSPAPVAPTTPPAVPTGLTVPSLPTPDLGGPIPSVAFVEEPITFSWSPTPGADGYELDVGATIVSAEYLRTQLTTTSYTWSAPQPGAMYVSVTARNAAGASAPTQPIELIVISQKDYTEALFLGSGPLAQSPQSGCPAGNGRMAGWAAGTTVTVVTSPALTDAQADAAKAAARQASEATAGRVNAVTLAGRNNDLHPRDGQITVAVAAHTPCGGSAAGCAIPDQVGPGLFRRVSVTITPTSNPVSHEMGHALFGLCHVTVLNVGIQLISSMGVFNDENAGLSPTDVRIVRAVYAAGLRPGATRSAFQAAGLIR